MLMDDVLFLNQGELIFSSSVDVIRQERGVSIYGLLPGGF